MATASKDRTLRLWKVIGKEVTLFLHLNFDVLTNFMTGQYRGTHR